MSIHAPELAEIYSAACPTDDLDSRAGTVWLMSIALLAFALARKPDGVDILGMSFPITHAYVLGGVLCFSTVYSSVQLWIAWYLDHKAFLLKYGHEWAELRRIFAAKEADRRSVFERVSSESDHNRKIFEQREDRVRLLQEELKPFRDEADAAYRRLRAVPVGSSEHRKAADDAEAAEENYIKEKDDRDRILARWDEDHHWPQSGDVAVQALNKALKSQNTDFRDLSGSIGHLSNIARVVRSRRWLELIGPSIAAVAACAAFGGWALARY